MKSPNGIEILRQLWQEPELAQDWRVGDSAPSDLKCGELASAIDDAIKTHVARAMPRDRFEMGQ